MSLLLAQSHRKAVNRLIFAAASCMPSIFPAKIWNYCCLVKVFIGLKINEKKNKSPFFGKKGLCDKNKGEDRCGHLHDISRQRLSVKEEAAFLPLRYRSESVGLR